MIQKILFLVTIILAFSFFLGVSHPTIINENSKCKIVSAGQYFDGKKFLLDGPYYIKLTGSFIESVQEHLSDSDLNNCEQIDHQQNLIIPGLIDLHTHLLATGQFRTESWAETLSFSALMSKSSRENLFKINSLSMLEAGFTTVRDLGNSGSKIPLNNTDLNFYSSGPGLVSGSPQVPKNPNLEYTQIDEDTDLRLLILNLKNAGAQWVKIYLDNSSPESIMPFQLAEKIVKTAHSFNLKVAAHAEYRQSYELAIKINVDTIEHAYQMSDKIHSINLIPTFLSYESCRKIKEKFFRMDDCLSLKTRDIERVHLMKKNGFNWAFGSDAVLDFSVNSFSRGLNSLEHLIYISEIFKDSELVLSAATSKAADILEIKAGQIKPGYKADLLVLPKQTEKSVKNLEFLKQIKMIYLNGKPFLNRSLLATQTWR